MANPLDCVRTSDRKPEFPISTLPLRKTICPPPSHVKFTSPGGPGAGLAPGFLIFFYESARLAAAERLRLCGLPEGDPESVDVTNSELTHAVESIIEVHHDLNPVLEASVQLIDVLGGGGLIKHATVLRARFSP